MTDKKKKPDVIITPALRRGMIRVYPDYFRMSVLEQEKYRVTMPKDDRFIIWQQLFNDLLNVSVRTQADLDKAHDEADHATLNTLNAAMLPIQGIGENYFWLNEGFDKKTLLDFETLYDYDLDDHHFQEAARQRDFPDYEIQLYRGSLYCRWVRLFIDDVFTYGILNCAAGYLLTKIESHGSAVMDRLLPHEYVRSKNHGKQDGEGFLFDLKIDANGKEEQYEELRSRYWNYERERYRQLQDIWDSDALGCAYLIDTSHDNDTEMTFVFSDKTALQSVRLRHFMADCRKIETSTEILDERIRAENDRTEEFLIKQYDDIEKNFDPKIKKFRKKRKIFMAPSVADELDG